MSESKTTLIGPVMLALAISLSSVSAVSEIQPPAESNTSSGNPAPALFDVAEVPFSRFGSWMSFSIPRKEKELQFRSHHNGENNICPLQVLADGEIVKPGVGSSRVDLQACKLEYSIVSPK